MQIDLNCDVGEGIGNEASLMPFISSANIACGFHAGDQHEMQKMVSLCLRYNVAIGAHPSFPDKANFGRTAMHFSATEIQAIIQNQLNTLNKFINDGGTKMHHVKLHGALYNMAARDSQLAKTVATAVKDFDSGLIYYGLAGSVMTGEATQLGLNVAQEAFADRSYQADGSLTPRSAPNALITDTDQAVRQVLQIINTNMVSATNGENIPIRADTICLHGDGPGAMDLAKKINQGLLLAGIEIKRL